MKKLCLLVLLLIFFKEGYCQWIFESNAGGGLWTNAGTWTCRGDLVDCTGAPSVPGATDVALISSNSATAITVSGNISVGDIYFMSDVVSNKISKSPLVASTITINGILSGILPDLSDFAEPVNAVFVNQQNLTLAFTGANGSDPVITSWGHNAPLPSTTFNSAGSISVESFSVRRPSIIQGGTLQIASGHELRDFTGSSTLTVNSGATLLVSGSIGRGTDPTTGQFGSVTINGTATTTASSYINSATFNLGSSGVLNVGFNGVNQTQGWWYQSNSPTSNTLNATSTVNYSSNTFQNVAAGITYGNLTMTSTSGVVKTLSGSGLTILGNLTIGANVTTSPASLVLFSGTATQSISGAGTLNFNGGLEVNKASGILTLNTIAPTTINGGLTVTSGAFHLSAISTISGGVSVPVAGTFDLGDVATTLSGGSFDVDGIVTSGTSGTFTVSGNSVFSGAGSLTFNNLTTEVTGIATINNSAFSVTGSIVNNGSLVLPSSSSTITFNGASAQAISGNPFSVADMVVNKSATLSNNTNVTLLGTLTMTTGTFDVDGSGTGNFVLNSDTNSDARIGPMAGGSITGEVTFQRYFINTTVNRWRNFSFPVTSVGYTELAPLSLQANSLATYNESVLGNVDQGWSFVNGGTLNSTRGHTAWMYNAQPITLSLKGPLLQNVPATPTNRYNFVVTYTNDPGQPASQDGWNFVVNPFACPINWNSGSGWVKNGSVVAAAAVWDEENYVYRVSTVDWNGVVAAGQGFWVQTIGASPDLRCEEAVKVSFLSNPDPTFYRQADNQVESKVLISLKSGERVDRAMIQFRKGATEEFDAEFDFYKLKNGIFNLSTLTNDGSDLAANVLPGSKCGSLIKLNVTNISPGTYSLSIDGLESFDNLQSITLIDRFTEKSQIVKENDLYSFEVTGDPDSFGSERFQLQFDFTDDTPNPVIAKEGNRLVSSSLSGNQWYLNDTPIEGATGRSFVPSVHGEYHVRVQDGRCNLRSESIPVIDCLNRIFPNPASEWLKVDVYHLVEDGLSGRILIHSAQGQLVRDESFNSGDTVKDIDILDVKPGSYIVTVVSGTGVILEKSKVVIK